MAIVNRKKIEAIYPLSPMQQGMLFHTLYAPKAGVYVEQISCTLQGSLNIAAFERAWQKVLNQHPILRTAFVWEEIDEPLQVVGKRVMLPLTQQDWRALSSAAQEEQLAAFIQTERERGFKLSKAPLMRLSLIRLAEDRHQLVWSFHHLLLDGWSTPLLLKEVFACYGAFCQGENIHLHQVRPYGDYIAWLQQQDMSQAEAYWRQRLKGVAAPTPLGMRQLSNNQNDQEAANGRQRTQLSSATTSALQALAQQHQLTVNTFIQGAWALLLSRYNGENDIVFGTTTSGRPADLAGAESMIGVFINTLPVRVRVKPDAPLLPWLKQLQNLQIESRQYEYSPLVQIHGWSDVPRGVPLFETLLIFENYPVGSLLNNQITALEIQNVRSFQQVNYPITLLVMPGARLSLLTLYDRHRFDAPTITQMLGHFKALLENMVANAHQRLKDISLLTEAERQRLSVIQNGRQVKIEDKKMRIHELFEAQVRQRPDALAVHLPAASSTGRDGQNLTYATLNRRANQVAHYLQTLGVSPGNLIGIYLERSLEMAVGLLGILKAGCAYVPLDPAYPTERLAFMLQDAQVATLVTQKRLLNQLPQYEAPTVCLDTDWSHISKLSTENLGRVVFPDNLAYLIYTSGSTGRPKGVMITHRNLCHYTSAIGISINITTDDTYLHTASFSFSSSVRQLMVPLTHGSTVVIAPAEEIENPLSLFELMKRNGVTVIDIVPSYWRSCAYVLSTIAPASRETLLDNHLRLVLSASEPLFTNLPYNWRTQFGQKTSLINMFGQTETTGIVSIYPIPLGNAREGKIVPIGRPIPNTSLYLLDHYMRPVPPGVPGEIYIGGLGIGQGYLNRPGLTAEKFTPHPFNDQAGARLYRTGDQARYLPDGTIEFIGRADHQVKIRGFRIELKEIESVLNRHPAVREAIATAHRAEGAVGERRLIAYIVPSQNPPSAGELRHYLQKKLPDYMIPSAFVSLEALPLTPTGKVDRHAMPSPKAAMLTQEKFVPPRTQAEKVVARTWSKLLNVEHISIHDNFFELGGHSLLAIQLASHLQKAFQIKLPLRQIFETPTVAGVAEGIETIRWVIQRSQTSAKATTDGREEGTL